MVRGVAIGSKDRARVLGTTIREGLEGNLTRMTLKRLKSTLKSLKSHLADSFWSRET